ncbi:MAG: GNAT family N-acetyltransferase [Clostridia bacterium]|nr:GNAT family N-acetyltransferase [Clostridia bacterium]
MKIKKVSFISPKLKREYNKLYSSSDTLSVFQSYTIIKRFFSFSQKTIHFLFNIIYKRNSKSAIYILCDDDGLPVLIVPVSQEGKDIRILGSREGLEYTDMIYSISDISKSYTYFNYLLLNFKKQGYNNLIWDFVPNYSVSKAFLEEYFEKSDETEYVRIKLPKDNNYDDYYHSLSKHTRQNVRTAYNRAQKESIKVDFSFYRANDKEFKAVFRESLKIYTDRQKSKYGDNIIGEIQKKYFHYLSNLPSCDCGAIACLYFNGKMVACMQGLCEKVDKSFSVPRLAIDMKYSFYSPGVLLINETIKFLLKNTDLQFLDLTRGSEQYKLDMGGEIYLVQNYKIDLTKLKDKRA